MQRRMFLVLALISSALAQSRSGRTDRLSEGPTVDVDMGSPSSLSERSATDMARGGVPDSAFVSASDLAAPGRARKEFEKANQSFANQNWTQARDRLNRAISIYPSYASAYNNLAVAYAHLGDVNQERQSLEKAVALDDRFPLAHLNVGRLDFQEGKLPEAETALSRAATLAPQDTRAFVLLAYCQLLQRQFDDAIATSYEAHKLLGPHASVHRVAARAFEQKNQFDRAMAELNIFLREQPAGPAAEEARKELQIVKTARRE